MQQRNFFEHEQQRMQALWRQCYQGKPVHNREGNPRMALKVVALGVLKRRIERSGYEDRELIARYVSKKKEFEDLAHKVREANEQANYGRCVCHD